MAVSYSDLHHLVQALRNDFSASRPTPPTVHPTTPAPPNPPPDSTTPLVPQPFSGPALSSGESQLRRLFLWLSKEVAQLVYEDRLPPHDLGRLRNPAKVPASKETEPGVLVNGVRVTVPEPAAVASSSKNFLRLLPDVRSFAQAWTVYTSLRFTSVNDPLLSASLGAFLAHVIDLDIIFLWPVVAEYVLAVCRRRFSFATASDWVAKDLDAWQEELGCAPPTIDPTPALQHEDLHHARSVALGPQRTAH
ncbi:hypothetical protein NDA18_005445 [Ustilago nuda]|nr:hypothetical protein NDA18_005445 [Ustilago nuda]